MGAPVPVGNAPSDVKVSGRFVLVGHMISNDLHLLHLDRFGMLYPLDVEPLGTTMVTSVAVRGRLAVASTYGGDVHGFIIGPRQLIPLGAHPTGLDLTDVEISDRGVLFATGWTIPAISAFELDPRGQFQQVGTLPLAGSSFRKMALVRGWWTTYVLINEQHNNQTVEIAAQPE